MHLFRSKLLVVGMSMLLLAIWFAGVAGRKLGNADGAFSAAAGPPAVDADHADAQQWTFTDSGQQLGGDVESSAVALGDIDADGDLDAAKSISTRAATRAARRVSSLTVGRASRHQGPLMWNCRTWTVIWTWTFSWSGIHSAILTESGSIRGVSLRRRTRSLETT